MSVSLNDNALITEAELNTMCGLSLAPGDYAKTLINIASDFIMQTTGRWLKAKDYTAEVYDGNGKYYLFPWNYPINSLTTLQQIDTISGSAIITYVLNTDYLWDSERGRIYLRWGFAEGVGNYKLTYNAGYTTVPYDIRYACAQLCQFMNTNKSKPGLISESIGAYSYSKESKSSDLRINGMAVPSDIAEVISRYIREDF